MRLSPSPDCSEGAVELNEANVVPQQGFSCGYSVGHRLRTSRKHAAVKEHRPGDAALCPTSCDCPESAVFRSRCTGRRQSGTCGRKPTTRRQNRGSGKGGFRSRRGTRLEPHAFPSSHFHSVPQDVAMALPAIGRPFAAFGPTSFSVRACRHAEPLRARRFTTRSRKPPSSGCGLPRRRVSRRRSRRPPP